MSDNSITGVDRTGFKSRECECGRGVTETWNYCPMCGREIGGEE